MDIRDIRNADYSSILSRSHRNVTKRFRIENSAKRTDRKRRFSTFDRTRREFQVALFQGSSHLRPRDAKRLHTHRVNPQAHHRALFTPDCHFRNAVNRLQAFLHMVVRNFRNFHRVKPIAYKTHHQNRVVIAIGLVDRRFIDIIRQTATHTAHAVADFICSRFQVHARFKFDADVRETIAARRGQSLDSRCTVDGGFQDFSDFRFDHGSVCTRVRSTHLNQRIVDVRVFTNAERAEPKKSEQKDDKRHHCHEHWATDGELAYAHYSTS